MTAFLAFPPARSVAGAVRVPSSKSATNRALVLAALSESEVEIIRPLESDDTSSLRRCLEAMGASFRPTLEGLAVHGPLSGQGEREVLLDAGDSGTAARFLAAVAAVTPGRFLLTGSERLRERPMGELVAALSSAGAAISFAGAEGLLPLAIRGAALRSGRVRVDAARSSQFVSALLLAGVAVEGGLEIEPTGPVASAPYVRTTLETLAAFGHRVAPGPVLRSARGGASPVARYEPPGDYSSGITLLAAAGAAGGFVTALGLPWPSHDADAQALPVLESAGLLVRRVSGGIAAAGERGRLAALSITATDFPDAVPALAALAALAPGESVFAGIGHLRLKESDRIDALATLLTQAGARAVAGKDTLVVVGPASPPAGSVKLATFSDHRIAMAAALLSLALPGLLIENPEVVAKSYPGFFKDLESIVKR